MVLGFILLMAWNGLVSWANAHFNGRYITEVKIVGGWPRFLVWCGLIMAGVGFTWLFFCFVGIGGMAANFFTEEELLLFFDIGYLLILPPLLTIGTVIWAHSLLVAFRRRQFGDAAIAGYNTIAHARNVISAAKHAPDAFGRVLSYGRRSTSKKDSPFGKLAEALKLGPYALAIILVVLCVCGGVVVTAMIARHADKKYVMQIPDPETA